MFWTAMDKVNSAAVTARSRVTGVRNRPRLWRIPIPRLSSKAAPIRISRVSLCSPFPFMCSAFLSARSDGRLTLPEISADADPRSSQPVPAKKHGMAQSVHSTREQGYEIEPAADQPADDRAVHPDVLQVGADRRLDAVGEGARLPFADDLGDKADQVAAPRQGFGEDRLERRVQPLAHPGIGAQCVADR